MAKHFNPLVQPFPLSLENSPALEQDGSGLVHDLRSLGFADLESGESRALRLLQRGINQFSAGELGVEIEVQPLR